MALNFGGGSSQRVEVAASASVDNFSAFTLVLWVRWAANTANRGLFTKGVTFEKDVRTRFNNGNQLNLIVKRATTEAEALSANVTAGNTLHYLAFTFDETDGPRIFRGTLTEAVAELSYSIRAVGSGATTADDTSEIRIGNIFQANSWNGDISSVQYINRRLTLGELRMLQFHPCVVTGSVIHHIYGYNGTGAQPDWSGNGNHGAVTGATIAAHVPLRPAFSVWDGYQGNAPAAPTGVVVDVFHSPIFRSPIFRSA